MAVNPMQRKANNSFLLGILITLLITGVIIALLLMQVSKLNKEKAENDAKKVYAYVLIDEVKSGTEIEASHVQGVEVSLGVQSDIIYSSQTKDSEGNPTADLTGNLLPLGLKAKVDLHPGTILTSDVTYEEELVADDVRMQEYNIIQLPSQIATGEYVDVRLRLPNGQDYIVVSHKQVTIPTINGVDSEDCVWIEMSELETVTMSNAIVEAYKMNGAKLYMTRYVEAGMQEAATVTYIPSQNVLNLIAVDSNIVETAKQELYTRMKTKVDEHEVEDIIRNPINSAVNNEDATDNLEDGVKEEIQGLQEEREKYLESLGM